MDPCLVASGWICFASSLPDCLHCYTNYTIEDQRGWTRMKLLSFGDCHCLCFLTKQVHFLLTRLNAWDTLKSLASWFCTYMLFYFYPVLPASSPVMLAARSKLGTVFARTLGSWVRIPRKAWMFRVCMRLFCICVVLCLGSGLATDSFKEY
jgi:hypothetical protein